MKQERKGELFTFVGAVLTSFFPILTILSYKSIPSMISLTVSTFVASIFFLIVLIYKKKLSELKNPILWKYIVGIVFFISILYWAFYYLGLTRTTSGNASIIALFEVCTSYVFFNLFKKEQFSLESKIGTALMVVGAVVVLAPNFSVLNRGDFLVFIATFCAPVGNWLQQKATKISSTETILFLRNIVATPFLLLLAYVLGQHLEIHQIKASIIFLILNGVLVLGLAKAFWVEGIARISVTKANALNSIGPLFTLFFAFIIFQQIPTIWQCASLVLFFFGVLLLTDNLKLKLRHA